MGARTMLRRTLFVCLDRALAQFPLWWCQVNGVQSSYCNDFETKVELDADLIYFTRFLKLNSIPPELFSLAIFTTYTDCYALHLFLLPPWKVILPSPFEVTEGFSFLI